MSERKFTKSLGKPGTAAQLRETVSQVVRESAVNSKANIFDPIDFEQFLIKNQTVLKNDPHRELLLYPNDDISQVELPRRYRTISPTFPSKIETENCNLFTKECIKSYSTNWQVIHFKYSQYSNGYGELPSTNSSINNENLKEQLYEIDIDEDCPDENNKFKSDNITKEGWLMKGPEIGSEKGFVHNMGSKSFKKRYCYLRQEVDGTYILEMFKDEQKGEAKMTIVMDFCTDVVKNLKRGGKYCFELRMTAGRKSYVLAAENETDFKDWLDKLVSVLHQYKLLEEKHAASLEREKNITTPLTSSPAHTHHQSFGTLKGLEQSLNPQLIKYSRETYLSIASARKESRQRIFQLYPPLGMTIVKYGQNINSQEPVEPFKEMFGNRVFFKCENINLKLKVFDETNDNFGQVEPYYTTLCLFDAKNGRKLTEDFHFDVNCDNIRTSTFANINYLLNENNCDNNSNKLDILQKTSIEWLQYPRQGLFNITNPHPDIFLFVRIEKVLQGGINQSSDAYVKANKEPKIPIKCYKQIGTCIQRLGKYRMPFAWTARPLYRLYSNELDTVSDFHAIYRQESCKLTDEEVLKILSDYRKPDKFNKFTIIPGSIEIKIAAFNDIPSNSLTASLAPLKPFPLPPTNEPTFEITEFEGIDGEKDLHHHPYTTFFNHLYVYPLNLNFDTQKIFTRARNICCCVELRDSDNLEAKPIACIYGRPGQKTIFVSSKSCAVLHHNTVPSWYEEIKIRLPTNLLYSHHILFTFYHISCDISKKRGDNNASGVENCIGYAWLPLIQKGKLNVDVQNIPIATNLPPGYLSVQPFGLGKGNAGPEITWVDGQKSLFSVGFQLISSVNTKDQHLLNFFLHVERLLDSTNKPTSIIPSESETCKILKALHAIQLTTLITFLPTIFNQLFSLLVATVNEEIGLNVIRVMINLVNMLCDSNRKDILNSYVKYVFVSPQQPQKHFTTVHEEMAKYLPIILDPNNPDFLVINKFMHHSDFFFEIIIKSMTQYLLSTGRIKMQRHERFSKEYLNQLEMLSETLISYILNNYKEMPLETKELNKHLANLLKKELSLIDRGFVFKLIKYYMNKFNAGDPRILQEIKFNFLEIICNHEHFISLNLPVQLSKLSPRNRSPDFMDEYSLSEKFSKHHFIVALLLEQVKSALNEVNYVRRIALTVLRNLIAKHELDERYHQTNKGKMERIALLYLPWLSIILENFGRISLHQDGIAEENGIAVISEEDADNNLLLKRLSSSSSYLFGKSTTAGSSESTAARNHRFTLNFDNNSPMHLRNSAFFDAIAGQSLVNNGHSLSIDSDISGLSGNDDKSTISQNTTIIQDGATLGINNNNDHVERINSSHMLRYDKLQSQDVRDSLLILLFVVKYLGEEQLIMCWQSLTEQEIMNFFTLLEISLSYFKYSGMRHVNLIRTPETEKATKPKSKKAHTLPARINPAELNHENCSTLIIHTNNRENLIQNENPVHKKQQAILEQHLSSEIGLIVLDCIGLYSINFRKKLLTDEISDNSIIKKIMDIFLAMLQIGQSDVLFKHIFAALRAFMNNFSSIFFQGNAQLCGKLCYQLLKCCNSRIAQIRQESCALLYLLMRSNFEFMNRKGLTRVHLQVIISVSQMLGNDCIGLNNARFQESLSRINSYASSDKAMKGTGFPTEVKDLTKRIRTVLMATVQIREHHQDPEMFVDLQHSLANSYASTPELRHTWLETMCKNHIKDGNYSEAACCQLHIAALMAEYLKQKKLQNWGAEAFHAISMNIPKDEKSLKLDSGVQDIQYTEQSLLEQLEMCAEFIDKSERYEIMGELYKLILPMYEHRRNYEQLKKCYQNLALNYDKVIEINKSGRRLLGRYYRVGFYGIYFEDENGKEFVYKEPKVTALSEISERLEQQFLKKFGPDSVKMIQDSIPVNQDELDGKYAYIQVTHLIPYFEKTELIEDRQTEFEQNHNFTTFMYETPFTKDGGKARGNPEEQWKRRTILKTQYNFPYVKKKIPIESHKIIELKPIEVAIDEMQQRVAELEDVVFSQPTDAKKLQLRLQGSVCVQVNAGPLAYAQVFLDPSLSKIYPDDKVEELKDIFREFLKICYSALQINGKLIAQDQQEYQEVLRQNYKKLCTSLSNLFGESLWPHDEMGSFKRNSMALFSSICGISQNSSTA